MRNCSVDSTTTPGALGHLRAARTSNDFQTAAKTIIAIGTNSMK